MDIDLYCKVYLSGNIDKVELIYLISKVISGKIEMRTITSEKLIVDVFETHFMKSEVPPDDFIQSPFYLEIESTDEDAMSLDDFAKAIVSLLLGLKNNNVSATPSCDFESLIHEMVAREG